ncbi:hypothetical protein EJ377_17970 [Chryseobacterium arthrosphaerae]|uniref:Uncharacterized protein n=1 Tax=Chryseobacterium arthrosphaerae TaxID=651561 RepID=A0A3S0NLW5_9FLAO|nr:hypothetical protein EJ377_17970 [Chryseobacterium arthrosphaerae]
MFPIWWYSLPAILKDI